MKITIVGGGNIGTQFAVHCAEKGHNVTVYTSNPELYNGHLNIVDENNKIIHSGDIKLATNNPQQAFFNAELIIVTVPAAIMPSISNLIFDNTNKKTIIGVVPGSGGSECVFRKCIERGNIFFGLERVPAIARLIKKGEIVKSTGYRNELHVAALPRIYTKKCVDIISTIFDIDTLEIPNFLNLTMTPSNPILHTTRLRSIFKDWKPGHTYKFVPLFYEDWDDSSSKLLIACDEEVQRICRALPEFDLKYVKSLRNHYESSSIDAMTKKISSINAFKKIVTPTIETNGGFIPDLHSRYFTSDFSYGLSIIKQVANFAKVQTPNINETIAWYKNIAVETQEFRFEDYGIFDKNSFDQFYLN